MNQIKKDPNDPDWDQINPDIVALAKTNGFIRQPINLYLHGELTWRETLEAIVLLLTKEFREQQNLLVATLQDRPELTPMLNLTGKLVKALPPRPLNHE